MQEIKIDNIIRSKRKSFSIELDKEGILTVRAPSRASVKEIKDVVNKKSSWILKKRRFIMEKRTEFKPKEFVDGEKFLLLGNELPLKILDAPNFSIKYEKNQFLLDRGALEHAKDAFELLYRNLAKRLFRERIAMFSSITKIPYNKVKITDAKTRWGSCSSRKNLNFSWRLVMAPSPVIDYVLVHELAHIIELNHSPRFWNLVEQMFPDYKKYKRWLRDNGHLLEL